MVRQHPKLNVVTVTGLEKYLQICAVSTHMTYASNILLLCYMFNGFLIFIVK